MTTPAGPPSFDLAFLFNQCAYSLAARMSAALDDLGLSVGQYCVLWKAGETERTQIEIAEVAALDKTSVVNAVDELESLGLATRRVHDTDRRAKIVSLTKKGTSVLASAHRTVAAVYEEALGDLGADERRRLVASLTKMTAGTLATPSHVTAQRRRRIPRPAARA